MTELSRKEKEKQQHREDILDAALELFSENGYVNVSMQAIAERAEFATGTLYNFFKNKEELYKALIMTRMDETHRVLSEALERPGTPVEKIRAFLTAKGKIFKAHTSFARLYISEIRGLGFILEKGVFTERLNDLVAKLQAVFENGIQAGVFRKHDPEFLAVSLNGISSVILIHMTEHPGRFDYMDNIDTMLNVFLNGILTYNEAE